MLKEKTQRQLAHEHNKLAQVAAFDHLPGAARVSGPVLDVLADISPATRWRWIASGKLPRPGDDGNHSADQVRTLLATLGAQPHEPGARSRRLKTEVRDKGIKERLTLSSDHVLLSGHRRLRQPRP